MRAHKFLAQFTFFLSEDLLLEVDFAAEELECRLVGCSCLSLDPGGSGDGGGVGRCMAGCGVSWYECSGSFIDFFDLP